MKKKNSKVQHFFLPEVVSEGTTGEAFVSLLRGKDFGMNGYAMEILRKKEFISTTGTKYKPVVIFGKEIEEDFERTTEKILRIAEERNYLKSNAELAPMLLGKISSKEMKKMGVKILVIVSHTILVEDPGGRFPYTPGWLMLCANNNNKNCFLSNCYARLAEEHDREIGFVFLAPKRRRKS